MVDDAPDVREAALRKWRKDSKRGFELATLGQRLKALGAAGRERVGAAPLQLKQFVAATNADLATCKLSFRGAVVHAKGEARFGAPMSKRNSLLGRSMAAPYLLKRAGASGNGRLFPCARVWLIDGDAVSVLNCCFVSRTVICRPKPKERLFELEILGKKAYHVPYDAVYAVAMDFIDDMMASDGNGVVVVTMAIVASGKLQLLSLELLKKDINTCRMLVNLKEVQEKILESAIVEGNEPSPRSDLLRAAVRDRIARASVRSTSGPRQHAVRVDTRAHRRSVRRRAL